VFHVKQIEWENAMTIPDFRTWLWPLRSRKVQVAIATVVLAYAAQMGMVLSEETITTVLGVGVALILGIAHEDAGKRTSGA
jgi:hypothetical protein